MANILTYNVLRTPYVNVRANGSCYTVLLEQARATNYLQADFYTKQRFLDIYVYLFTIE